MSNNFNRRIEQLSRTALERIMVDLKSNRPTIEELVQEAKREFCICLNNSTDIQQEIVDIAESRYDNVSKKELIMISQEVYEKMVKIESEEDMHRSPKGDEFESIKINDINFNASY